MKGLAPIRILSCLPDRQFVNCIKYLQLFGGKYREDYINLIEYYKENKDLLRKEKSPNVHAITQVALKKEMGKNQASQYNSELRKLMEQFLVLTQIRENKNRLSVKGQLLFLDLATIDYDLFLNKTTLLEKHYEQKLTLNEKDHFELFKINESIFFHPNTDRSKLPKPYLADANIHLDMAYLLSKLKIVLEQKLRSQIYKESYSNEEIDIVLQLAELYKSHPAVNIYCQLIDTFDQRFDQSLFKQLKGQFILSVDNLNIFDRKNIISKLIYLASYSYERGDLSLLDSIFSLYKIQDQLNLIIHKGKVHAIVFLNHFILGLHLKKYDWTSYYMQKYVQYIPPEVKKNTLTLISAYESYYRFDVEQTENYIAQLQKAGKFNLFIELRFRIIKLWVVIERLKRQENQFSYLEDQINAFRQFLKYNKLMDENKKTTFFNMLKGVSLLSLIIETPPSREKDLHIQEMSTLLKHGVEIFSRQWLSEQFLSIQKK